MPLSTTLDVSQIMKIFTATPKLCKAYFSPPIQTLFAFGIEFTRSALVPVRSISIHICTLKLIIKAALHTAKTSLLSTTSDKLKAAVAALKKDAELLDREARDYQYNTVRKEQMEAQKERDLGAKERVIQSEWRNKQSAHNYRKKLPFPLHYNAEVPR